KNRGTSFEHGRCLRCDINIDETIDRGWNTGRCSFGTHATNSQCTRRLRSEERRVGKECREQWGAGDERKSRENCENGQSRQGKGDGRQAHTLTTSDRG